MDREMIDKASVDRATVQLNVRVPLRLRKRLDAYLQYLDKPEKERLKTSRSPTKWPRSNQGIVIRALEEFLESRPLNARPGPEKTQKEIQQQEKPITARPRSQKDN